MGSVVTFNGASGTTFSFKELNDPVMGGKSTGTWSVAKGYGIFDGSVVDVPSLKAPGFIKAAADGTFPDLSSAGADGALVLKVRSTTPEYRGFRVTLASGTVAPSYSCAGGGSIPFSRGCFKATFNVSAGSDFAEVVVPFTSFSDQWSPATGESTKTCADDSSACLTARRLKGIKRVELWAEGVKGKVHLEIAAMSARGASEMGALSLVSPIEAAPKMPPAQYNTCKGTVQSELRYNISTRPGGIYSPPNESMAVSVCCDIRMKQLAETQFLFEAPDIALFSHLDSSGVTTFFDSVCGLPLFRAPVNRSLADFKADTMEHGWPSFRPAEVITANVVTDEKSGFVTSKCGTHLGSYLPDAKGPRWCMDLSCIAGNPAH